MEKMMLVRFFMPDVGVRVGLQIAGRVYDVTGRYATVADWLKESSGRLDEAMQELRQAADSAERAYEATLFDRRPTAVQPHWLAPVDHQEVWAAGVTYLRSRNARQEEALDGGDVYGRVYQAARPELFYKAPGWRVVGPLDQVGIRSDATWNVPEPELGLLINPTLDIVGMVVGNDMSSRDIEGANPLYLPQAKVYDRSCSLGPGLLINPLVGEWPQAVIRMRITRDGRELFEGQTDTSQIKRSPQELVSYLGRALSLPDGAVLLTGTGIVPPDDFNLQERDQIVIEIEGLGRLENRVVQV